MNKVPSVEGKKVYCNNNNNADYARSSKDDKDEHSSCTMQLQSRATCFFFFVNRLISLRTAWKMIIIITYYYTLLRYESKHFCSVVDEHVYLWLLLLSLNKHKTKTWPIHIVWLIVLTNNKHGFYILTHDHCHTVHKLIIYLVRSFIWN